MHTYRVTYKNPVEVKKTNIEIYQYCTIKAKNMAHAIEIFDKEFCWEAVKVQKIN